MTSFRFGACAVLVGLVAACGEGRAILNIDILSFYPAGALDTAYAVPGGTAGSIALDPVTVSTVELGGSTIDTVLVTVAADVANTQGSGSLAFEVFFSDSLSTLFTPAHRAATDTAVVSGVGTGAEFPTPPNLLFFLRYWERTGGAEALHMGGGTVDGGGEGGGFDHVG